MSSGMLRRDISCRFIIIIITSSVDCDVVDRCPIHTAQPDATKLSSSRLPVWIKSATVCVNLEQSEQFTVLYWEPVRAVDIEPSMNDTIRYDTIRDVILTCARKPTWIGLIYRTETTTKNCKTEKLKSKSRYVRSNSKSLGNHVVRSEKRKRKAAVGRICRKRF